LGQSAQNVLRKVHKVWSTPLKPFSESNDSVTYGEEFHLTDCSVLLRFCIIMELVLNYKQAIGSCLSSSFLQSMGSAPVDVNQSINQSITGSCSCHMLEESSVPAGAVLCQHWGHAHMSHISAGYHPTSILFLLVSLC